MLRASKKAKRVQISKQGIKFRLCSGLCTLFDSFFSTGHYFNEDPVRAQSTLGLHCTYLYTPYIDTILSIHFVWFVYDATLDHEILFSLQSQVDSKSTPSFTRSTNIPIQSNFISIYSIHLEVRKCFFFVLCLHSTSFPGSDCHGSKWVVKFSGTTIYRTTLNSTSEVVTGSHSTLRISSMTFILFFSNYHRYSGCNLLSGKN